MYDLTITRPLETSLADQLRSWVTRSVSKAGVYPQHMLWRIGDKVIHETFGVPGRQMVNLASDMLLRRASVDELIFGVDTNDNKALRLTYDDAIVVGWFASGAWRIGVLNYQWGPIVVDTYDWNNQLAIDKMRGMIETALRERRKARKISPFTLFH